MSPTDRVPNLLQYLGYLLGPPVMFLFGYLLAKFLFPMVDLTDPDWCAPVVVGCMLTVVYATVSISPMPFKRDLKEAYLPPRPNNKTLALTKAVSAAIYALIAAEFVIFRLQPNYFTQWDTTVIAIGFPVLILITAINFYRACQKLPTG